MMSKTVKREIVDPETGEVTRTIYATVIEGESRTKQSFKEECDINRVMAKYARYGEIPLDSGKVPRYGDFSEVGDYQNALSIVMEAEEEFRRLPARVRERFDNDPQKVLDFLADPANLTEAVEIGLVQRPHADPAEVPPAPQSPAQGVTSPDSGEQTTG